MKWFGAALAAVMLIGLAAGCKKKGGACDGAKQTALQAIGVAHQRTLDDLVESTKVEAELAMQGSGSGVDVSKQQDQAHVHSTMLKLRGAMLDSWRAMLGGGSISTVSPTPDPDEPPPVTTARTLMIAYAAQCAD